MTEERTRPGTKEERRFPCTELEAGIVPGDWDVLDAGRHEQLARGAE